MSKDLLNNVELYEMLTQQNTMIVTLLSYFHLNEDDAKEQIEEWDKGIKEQRKIINCGMLNDPVDVNKLQ